MNLKHPRFLLIASMVIFGTIALFVRKIPLPSGEIALYRASLAALLIGIYLLLTRQKITFGRGKRELVLLLLSGIAMGINWILLFEAYKYTTVSAATRSYYFAPVIVTAVCPVLFRERLNRIQVLCFVMSTAGLVLITGIGSIAASDLRGIALGGGAAVFYAAVILFNKFIRGVGGIHRTFLQFLAAIVTLLPYVAVTGGFHIGTLDSIGWLSLLTVGLFHTGITYCMYFTALRDLPGQKSAILSYIDPLTAVLVSVFVLGETITLPQILGGILILGFSLWNELASAKE